MYKMEELEKQIEQGLVIQELIRSDGWKLLEEKIKQEIEDERLAIVEIEEKDVYSTAVKFIQHQQMMKGLERIFEIIQEFLTNKENAELRLKQIKG